MQPSIRRVWGRLRCGWQGRIADRRGAVGWFLAAAMIPLLLATGVGVDGARGYLVKARLSQALDAAALAGGRVMFSDTRDSDILMYFNSNFPHGFMDATIDGPNISVSANEETLTLTASATVPTTFMKLAGYDTMSIGGRSVVTRTNRSMELVLVMDNTGSMYSNGKIGAMKTAAIDLLNVLYGSRDVMPNFWVGLVPYAAFVNIGNNHADWLAPGSLNQAQYAPSVWKGCVEARAFPFEETAAETLPAAQPWRPSRWASTAGTVYRDGRNHVVPGDNNWPPVRESQADLLVLQNDMTGPNIGCPPPIMGLQPSKSVAIDAINAMGPWFRGGTMGNLGLAWGWRVISPTWRGMWTGTPANLPLDYNTPFMDKVVVMLTDGRNEWYDYPGHAPGCAGVTTPCSFPDADYTAYGRLSEARLGTTNNGTALGILNNRMATLCTSMKAQGVTMYTIVLQENDANTQALFRNCASRPEYYFLSPTAGDLAAIFRTIGTQLSNLRIAQ